MGKLKEIAQVCLDKMDYFLYKKKVVLGEYPYYWCSIPVPANYPKQSQTHPSIVYDPAKWNGKTHWLATTPYPDASVRYENPCIYYADSGVSSEPPFDFKPIPENPIADWPGGNAYNSDPELFFSGNRLYCIVRENENARYLSEIKLLSSKNGLNWNSPKTIYTSNEPERQLLSPSYLLRENEHFIYFLNGDAGIGKNGTCTGIEIIKGSNFEAPDFNHWKSGAFLNKNEAGIEPWHFDLFEYQEKLFMIFCGRDRKKKTIRNPMETYLAVSEDYIHFYIYKTPVIRHLKTYRPSAYLDENNVLHLYFSVVGSFLNDGSDRNIAVTSIPFESLLNLLKENE